MANRDVDRRVVDEAMELTRELVEQTHEGEKIVEGVAAERLATMYDRTERGIEAEAELNAKAAQNERIAELERKFAEQAALIERFGLSMEQLSARHKDEMATKLYRARLQGLIERAGERGTLTVLIHPSPNEKENWPVDINLNGLFKARVRRGVPTKIPAVLVSVLDEARIEQTVPLEGPDGNVVLTPVSRQSYPFNVLEMGGI